jgi:thiol-disulfide isomerase/thioredoxin
MEQAITAFNAAARAAASRPRAEQSDARRQAADQALATLGVENLTLEQIEQLNGARIIASAGEMKTAVEARLEALSQPATAEGARAMAMRVSMMSPAGLRNEDEWKQFGVTVRDKMIATMRHPGLPEALKQGKGTEFLRAAQMMDPSALAGSSFADDLEKVLGMEIAPGAAAMLPAAYDAVSAEEAGTPAAQRERVRTGILAHLDKAMSDASTNDRVKASMTRARAYLDGAYARGELVGHQAPELNFTWTNFSGDNQPTKLSDLKGKVVVLDFWATWCGPCVVSFPQVRDLVKAYEGYDVVVLGVTSLQGSSTKWENGRPVGREDTTDNPEKEYELMKEFVTSLNMTWPVAFSTQEVFNPDYGVRGIPHVAIIDANGVVRHRGLHPASEPEKKHEMINALLKEAGKPFPGADKPAEAKGETEEAGS